MAPIHGLEHKTEYSNIIVTGPLISIGLYRFSVVTRDRFEAAADVGKILKGELAHAYSHILSHSPPKARVIVALAKASYLSGSFSSRLEAFTQGARRS